MIPSSHLAAYRVSLSERATSSELRTYLRDEWNAEPAWLYAEIRTSGQPLRIRLARWMHRLLRRVPQRETSDKPAPLRTAEAENVASPDDAPCAHPALEDLGFGGTAEYARCAWCGAVFVSQG